MRQPRCPGRTHGYRRESENKGKPYNFNPTVYIELPFQTAHPWRVRWNQALTMGPWADGGLRVGSLQVPCMPCLASLLCGLRAF